MKSINISGPVAQYLKSAEAHRRMWDETNHGPVIDESLQKSIKMVLKLKDNANHLIVGVRIKMGSKQNGKVKVKILNREVIQIKQSDNPLWYDVPFCDVEVIFAMQNNGLEIEFCSDDPK